MGEGEALLEKMRCSSRATILDGKFTAQIPQEKKKKIPLPKKVLKYDNLNQILL